MPPKHSPHNPRSYQCHPTNKASSELLTGKSCFFRENTFRWKHAPDRIYNSRECRMHRNPTHFCTEAIPPPCEGHSHPFHCSNYNNWFSLPENYDWPIQCTHRYCVRWHPKNLCLNQVRSFGQELPYSDFLFSLFRATTLS